MFLPTNFRAWLLSAALLLGACSPAALPTTPTHPPTTPTATPAAPDQPVAATPGGPQAPALPPPYQPQPGDAALTRGQAFIDEQTLLVLESFPPQIRLALTGTLPTPCHQLRVAVAAPDAQNRIQVDVYSVVDPGEICTQVLEPFQVSLPLEQYPAGTYSVWVNGQAAGEFTL